MDPSTAAPIRCRGFTVIELCVVITVTVLLIALAASAYRTHTVRGQVSEGMRHAESLQQGVAEAFRRAGEAPSDLKPGARPPHDGAAGFIAALTVENGRVDILYGEGADSAISGRRLSLTPYETATLEIVWVCGNEIPGAGLSPLGFAGGGRQTVQIATTIEPRYLPATCR